MVKIGSAASAKVLARIVSASAAFGQSQVRLQNVAADLAGRSATIRYPLVQVYCEKIVNRMTEKFRRFSGTLEMAIELRHSSDHLDGLQDGLEATTDTLTQILSANRGDWGDGMHYGGAYQVVFGAAKQGGKNFIQTAKVTFEIGASIN